MMKKIICLLSVLVVGITSNDVYAVSSVKKTGNTSITGVKAAVNTPKKQTEKKANNSRIGKTTKVATVKSVPTTSSSDKSRFPAITVFGIPKSGKTSVSANNADQSIKTSVVSEEGMGTSVTEVVEKGSGNYVTDVEAEGNKLNVTKTSLLYAPVRNGSDETIRGNAEIWVIK